MKGCAVKVTDVPEQMVEAVEVIFTESVTDGLMVMVMAGDVAGLPVTPARLEVITQVTELPFAKVVVV